MRQARLEALKEVIKTAYENGQSLGDIAVVYSSSPNTIRNVLRDMGVIIRPQGRKGRKGQKQDLSQLSVEQRYEWEDKKRAARGSPCPICSDVPEELVIDHCHKTGKVRGLICKTCNTGLGMLQDSIEILKKALEHLEKD